MDVISNAIDALVDITPLYMEGFLLTLALLGISGLGAFVLGIIIATMRISPVPALRLCATIYTEILRNIPLLLVLFFCAYVLPILGVNSDFFLLAVLGLTLYTSPFVAEAVRSGFNGVPVGQAEAARSIGMGFTQTVGLIILPQAGRMVVPPLINVFIALTKNTSVAGIFFVNELFKATYAAARDNGDVVVLTLVYAVALYLAITVPLGLIAGAIEKKVMVLR
ncbi:amino acid ABC transporter permease [Salinibacterium sp. SWN248]|uniref:amino acid ABC transporter permease n=1 Tax=Salinibacterium sp. SWN248 TaxID=2792056 RepID=UPI0018CE9698|nr:amino acid ABC transporter permease [Salinibacterium sp. SWN248]MBH0025346.1 amino acid ABC transporter permease [Salinibacterium sp. SWN248]